MNAGYETPDFPPRGSGNDEKIELLPTKLWGHPSQLGAGWDWRDGKLLLGMWEGRALADPDRHHLPPGSGDDRHLVTAAGSRAGKSKTVLIPNLLRYPGSAIVIDPKGELARATAKQRAENFGHHVAILDPFNTSGWKSLSYNPLSELDPRADTFIDDIGLVADALIMAAPKADPHWTDSAKSLIRGLILYMFASGGDVTLTRLRRLLLGSEGRLSVPDTDNNLRDYLFVKMAAMEDFDGLLAGIGASFLEKSDKELGSVLSTAREQTSFLDSTPLGAVLEPSDIRLSQLKRKPMTIYLCLPATRLATHARWLRLIISMALVELERDATVPRHPVLMMLEEFGALGYMRPIEYATGFMAGFGVRLWSILQDFTQLKTHYPNSWETFLGNAGIIQAFGNVDITTTEYLSKLLGNTRLVERRDVFVNASAREQGDSGRRDQVLTTPLLDPVEITQYFARETNRQLIISPGRPPIFMERLAHGQ